MKKDMPLEGLRWSRDSGSALYDTPQTAVLGRAGGASSVTSSEAELSADAITEDGNQSSEPSLTDEQKAIIEEKLQQWCLGNGYKDTAVNMLTLSDSIGITRAELTQYFDKCLDTTFRIWLANIRFEAAKTMMRQFPQYSNDLISAECGFSARTYLYRIFKEKTGKTPTEWRTGVNDKGQQSTV